MINFRLISEFQPIQRRPFSVATPAILNPVDGNPLLDGEFLGQNSAYKMDRDAAGTGTNEQSSTPQWCVFAERGRYETQAIQKVPMLYLGSYEAETKIMSAGTDLGADAIATVGQPLYVGNCTIGGLVKRGLRGVNTAGITNELSIGFVTRLPADNGGWLRFIWNLC